MCDLTAPQGAEADDLAGMACTMIMPPDLVVDDAHFVSCGQKAVAHLRDVPCVSRLACTAVGSMKPVMKLHG